MTEDTKTQSLGETIAGWLQLGGIIAFIVIGLAVTFSMSRSEPDTDEAAPNFQVPVNLITPDRTSHQIQLSLTGSVSTRADVSLTPQVSGRVVELSDSVREGASFSADEVLFRIDPRDYEVAVTRARSSLSSARSGLLQTQAEAEIAREEWESLYPGRPIEPLAALEPQLEAAEGQLLSAQADLADAQLNLSRTAYALPFDGRVLESQIEVGTLVNAGQSYGRVYEVSSIEIVAPVAPRDVARLDGAQNRPVQIVFEGGATLTGSVSRVGAGLDERTRFLDLFVTFSTDELVVQPGLFADLIIEGPVFENVFSIPANATPGIEQVYVVDNGVIQSQPLTVIDRTRDAVIVEPFDFKDGIVISSLPANAVGREASIVSLDGEAVR